MLELMKKLKNNKQKYAIIGIILLIFFLVLGGIIFFSRDKNKQKETQAKISEAEKREIEALKTEVSQLENQEKELKEQFANCQTLSEKKLIKEKLTSLQNTIFDKKEKLKSSAPTSASSSLKDKKNIDKKKLANSLKAELKKELEQRMNGTWKENCDLQNDPSIKFYFARHYLDEQDCQEIADLISQIQALSEAEREREELERDEKLENNPKLFYFTTRMTTERNGNWQHYHCFHGKHKGWNYEVNIPDNHPVLNNVLFNYGWGVNSEIGRFYLIEGIEKPIELHYWNIEKQKNEIIPEKEIIQATQEGKKLFYEKFVNLEENIKITYFQGQERE